jgi:hypothetical protein
VTNAHTLVVLIDILCVCVVILAGLIITQAVFLNKMINHRDRESRRRGSDHEQ